MLCPFCQTENREDRASCYSCNGDLGMLRVVANKARHHYNIALEHAERGRYSEAIDELHNALDLDSRLVPAYNLLGTLYARQGDVALARESWEKAMQVYPQLGNTYDYLSRLDRVQEQLPLLERLRQACLALTVIVFVLVASLFYINKSDRSQGQIRLAQQAYDNKHYGEALNLLNQVVSSRKGSSEISVIAADTLRRAISTSMDTSLNQIRDYTTRNEFTKAISAIADLEKNVPDQPTSKVLELLRNEVHDQFRSSIAALQKDYEDGRASYSSLTRRITDFLELYPEVLEKDDLRQDLAKARNIEVQRRVDVIREEFARNSANEGSVENAINQLKLLGNEFPGSDALTRERKSFVGDLLLFCYDRFNNEMKSQQYDLAQRHLVELSNFSNEFEDIVNYSSIIPELVRNLEQGIKDQQLLLTDQYIKNREYDAADENIRKLLLYGDMLTTDELTMVHQYMDRLNTEECVSAFNSTISNEKEFWEQKVTGDKAKRLLENYNYILKMLPSSVSNNQKCTYLSCVIISAKLLEKPDISEQAYDLLQKYRPSPKMLRALRVITPNLGKENSSSDNQ